MGRPLGAAERRRHPLPAGGDLRSLGRQRRAARGDESLALGDFAGNGRRDVAEAHWRIGEGAAGGVRALLANADGTLEAPISLVGTPIVPAVTTADLRSNGRDDVIFTTGGGQLGVALANANGTLQPTVLYDFGGGAETGVAVGDFNGDHHPDAFGDNVMLFGRGDGTFAAPVSSPVTVREGATVADVNRDGRQDLVDEGEVYLGNGNGTFRPPIPAPTGVVADFDRDGVLDIAGFGFGHGYVRVASGRGDGSFGPSRAFAGPPGAAFSAIAVGDLDGDRKPDLAVGNGPWATVFQNSTPVSAAAGPHGAALPRVLAGSGSRLLGTVTVMRPTTVRWTVGDGGFRLRAGGRVVASGRRAARGTATIPPGVYRGVSIRATGRWVLSRGPGPAAAAPRSSSAPARTGAPGRR